jgi:hypothetical protein
MVARPEGFEPPTPRFVVWGSCRRKVIQWLYILRPSLRSLVEEPPGYRARHCGARLGSRRRHRRRDRPPGPGREAPLSGRRDAAQSTPHILFSCASS